jgi:SanA protein
MAQYLLKHNIDASILIKDEKGDNTFQSVKNYKIAYGNSSAVIISQKMHLQRALFIARCVGIEAYGYIAPPPTDDADWFFYELFARAKSTCVLLHYFATR